MHATTVATDLAKGVFEMAFADFQGRIIERNRLSRGAFCVCWSNWAPLRLVIEAWGSAHYWAPEFQAQGHQVRLCLPACLRRAAARARQQNGPCRCGGDSGRWLVYSTGSTRSPT